MIGKLHSAYETIRKLLFYIVKYRIHLSVIFAFLLCYNNYKVSSTIQYGLIISLALWHFSLFLLDRIYDRKLDKQSQPDEYVKEKHAIALYWVVATCLIFSAILFLSYNKFYLWLILLPVTFLYTIPVIGKTRFKNIFLLKNLYSALLIYALPIIMQTYVLTGSVSLIHISSIIPLAIYVLIGEIFWDIRDISVDKQHNIKTIPNLLGLNTTRIIIAVLILIDFTINNFKIQESAVIYSVLLPFTNENTDRLIFHLPPLIALIRFCL